MNVNEKYWALAQLAAQTAADEKGLTNIDPRYLYCQFYHETGGFASWLAENANNFGGLKQFKDQPSWLTEDMTSPEGDNYQAFESPEDYAIYFGKYLGYYIENGIDKATTLEEYAAALKDGGYFGDTLENYINGCQSAWDEAFSE